MPTYFHFPDMLQHSEDSADVVCPSDHVSPLEVYPEYLLPPVTTFSDGEEIIHYTSDVYDLLNQERINNLGRDTLEEYLSRNMPLSSELSDQISKLSDDEILKSIKPRNIQTASEIRAWIDYLQGSIDDALASSSPSVDVSPSDDDGDDVPPKE